MTPQDWASLGLGVLAMVLMWGMAGAWQETRNIRLLAFLGLVSAAAIAGATYDHLAGRVIEVGAFATGMVAIAIPRRVGLASATPNDVKADGVLRRLEAALDGTPGARPGGDFSSDLTEPPFSTAGSPWETIGRFYRLMVARDGETEAEGQLRNRTPLWAYRRAARHYWARALRARVIGPHPPPTAWDEDLVLRSISEQFERTVPREALSVEPAASAGAWADEARAVLDAAEGLQLHHAQSRDNRALLVDAMRAQLQVARGDRSDGAVSRASGTAIALNEQWQVPNDER